MIEIAPQGISSARRRWFDTVPPGAVGTFQLVTSSEVPVAFHLDLSWVNICPTAGQSAPLQAASVSIYQHESLRSQKSYFLSILLDAVAFYVLLFCCTIQGLTQGRRTHSATEIHPNLCVSILTWLLPKHVSLMLVGKPLYKDHWVE